MIQVDTSTRQQEQQDSEAVQYAIEFLNASLASMQQVELYLEQMHGELEALKLHEAKADPARLSDRVQGVLVSLRELDKKWRLQLSRLDGQPH